MDEELTRDVAEALRRIGLLLGRLARDLEDADVKIRSETLHATIRQIASIEGRIQERYEAHLRQPEE